jgi:hypothetical protein
MLSVHHVCVVCLKPTQTRQLTHITTSYSSAVLPCVSAGTPLAQTMCAGLLANQPDFWRALGHCPDAQVPPWLPVLATHLLAVLQSCHSSRSHQWIKRLRDLGLNLQHGPKARPQLQRQLVELLLPDVLGGSSGSESSKKLLGVLGVKAAARILWNLARRCKVGHP